MGVLGVELTETPQSAVPAYPHCKADLRRSWYKAEGWLEMYITERPHRSPGRVSPRTYLPGPLAA
jgi:hypothetical protein